MPPVYSAKLSEFIFAARVGLMERLRSDIMCLSSTDYVQHKHAPGTGIANAFYRMLDGYWARLHEQGSTIDVTADNGMSPKHDGEGRINVIYLQDVLYARLDAGKPRVLLIITDPYVVYHGALGSFATAYLPPSATAAEVAQDLVTLVGVKCALTAPKAGTALRDALGPPGRSRGRYGRRLCYRPRARTTTTTRGLRSRSAHTAVLQSKWCH